jgi:hypothetical protein
MEIPKQHFSLNKSIEIKLPQKVSFMSGGLFGSTTTSVFKVPPLNAVIISELKN